MKKTKQALIHSAIALLLCISMLIGSTFAWFSDQITSGKNIITAGNLDLEMYWTDDLDSGAWFNVEDDGYNTIFNYDNWEPGYTDVKYIKLVNAGDLALNYELTLTPQNGVGKLAEVINVYFAEGGVNVENRSDLKNLKAIGLLNTVFNGGATAGGTLLADDQFSPLHPSGEVIMTVAMNMLTSAGNDYMNEDAGKFTITALATQAPFEMDSFGSDYDADAKLPTILTGGSASAAVTPANGKVPAGGVTLIGGSISAFVPEGVALADGASELTLTVTPLKNTTSDITVVNDEILIPVDVHIDGVAENNTVPIIVDLGEVLPKYLNMGNYHLYHVEDGTNHEMTMVADKTALTAHNQFTYNSDTGAVSVAMATFSEVALVADTQNAWNGVYSYDWYGDGTATEYTITKADDLAGFGKIVGGMADGIEIDDFTGKTVKLVSDINLNRDEQIFYPIGYYNNQSKYDRENATGVENVESSVSAFRGTFNGNGHTISNFYQNTWEMFGDYNNGYTGTPNYYQDAMGLFGYVNGGTVMNLTIDSFDSDGEFTPTGVIAAYAVDSEFKNIAITKCNPRVYNTGNGGIVGVGGNSDDGTDKSLRFTNITVDNTNTISALWGSWDVACGGIMGMFRGEGTVDFNNCHVAAKIDVFNDVCGNYQYYWYRYSGMMIGTNYNMTTDADGYTVPDVSMITATGCTVRFDEWNDYYYCELVANSIASYTHDHQFSRLVEVASVDVTNKTYTTLIGTTASIPTSGRYNYVTVNGDPSTENATCYHFVDGAVWNHEDAGKETVNGAEILKEDRQHYYLPFNQVFTGYGWGVKHIPISGDEGANLKDQGYDKLDITILPREGYSEEKFQSKFTGDFLYRVGNGNSVSIGSLFEAKSEEVSVSGVWVAIEKLDENVNVSGEFTPSTTNWQDGTIQFEGTGVVKVTIQDYSYCKPTTLYLEVVDATNVTAYSGLGNKNSVLLNDITMSSGGSYYLSGATLYGNGFTFDVTAGAYSGKNTSSNYLVSLSNAMLDNVQIIGAVYTTYGGTSSSDYNRATVYTTGDSKIANCYITNCAVPVRANGSVLEIINTTLEGGNFANLEIRSGTVILENVTTINQSNEDGSSISNDQSVVGLGIVFNESSANVELIVRTDENGNALLEQYNYISENVTFSDATANSLKTAIFGSNHTDLQREVNGVTWVNTGIMSMTEEIGAANIGTNITGYTGKTATVAGKTGYVYTPVPQSDAVVTTTPTAYESTAQYHIVPAYSFDHTPNNQAQVEDSNDYCYYNDDSDKVLVSFDEGDSKLYNLDILTVTKSGGTLIYTVTVDGATYTTSTIEWNETGEHTVVYTYEDPYNYKLADDGSITTYTVTYTKTLNVSVTAVPAAAKDAVFTFYGYGSESTTASTTITDTKTATSTSGNLYIMPSNTGTYVTSTTVDGITVNCPIVYVDFKDNTTDFNWLYPLFLGVKIDDYADGGTAETASTIVSPTSTSKPTNLTIITADKPSSGTGWSSGSGSSGSEGQISSGTYKGLYGWTSGAIGSDKTESYVYGQFSYQDNKGTVYYYVIAFYRADHNCPTACVTPDTLITLADGSQVRVDALTGDEMLLVWNHETGSFDTVPVAYIVNHNEEVRTEEIIHLYFSDGSDIKIIGEHVFFDATLNKYVALRSDNVEQYIGHSFVGINDANDALTSIELVKVDKYIEETTVYEVVSYQHLTCFTNNILSTSAYLDKLLNIFDIDPETMAYSAELVQKDIETYGLYTYADFEGLISEEAFEMYNAAYLKIAVGKGYITWDDILDLIDIYFAVDVQPIQ